VYLNNGLSRCYSLYGDQDEVNTYHIGVLHTNNSRGGSKWIHENFDENDLISISPPVQAFSLSEEAKNSILIAG
jgi:vanillate monooxygenase ferredoxin subunit